MSNRTSNTKAGAVFGAVMFALSAGIPIPAPATEHGLSVPNDTKSGRGVVYTSLAYSPAIHSYRNIDVAEREVANPQVVAVSLASGPAIYSYPRVSPDTVAGFELHYIDSAYGPAIYSYPGAYEPVGQVQVLPAVTE